MFNFNRSTNIKPGDFEKLTVNKQLLLLLVASFILLSIMLSTNTLWTVESRWAAACLQMQLRSDYLHPYLYNGPYYDKPLLSYWLILLLAKLFGNLNEWSLRLPSVLSGVLAIYCTYRLAFKLINQKVGILAGWLLLTTFYFVFWSRTASADMMTVAGTLLAVLWYFEHKNKPSFSTYFIFFLIMAITSLTKGLLGFVLPLLAIAPDLFSKDAIPWRLYMRKDFFAGLILAIIIYLIPFLLSTYFSDKTIHSSGLQEVIHENVQRFFAPFDHKDPFYTYFIYLPIYALPWTFFLLPALINATFNWKKYDHQLRVLHKSLLVLFLFLTMSGSRRSYYVLPLIPFATIITANWLVSITDKENCKKLASFTKKAILSVYIILLIWFGIVQPYMDMKYQKVKQFADKVRNTAKNTSGSFDNYKILVLNNNDNRVVYYLKPKQPAYSINQDELQKIILNPKSLHHLIVILKKNDLNSYTFDKHNQLILEDEISKKSNAAILVN